MLELVSELKTTGLLTMLARNGYSLHTEIGGGRLKLDPAGTWRSRGFTFADYDDVSRLVASEPAALVETKSLFSPFATTPAEFLTLFSGTRATIEDGQFFRSALPAFFASKPSLAQLLQAEAACHWPGSQAAIKREAIKLVSSTGEYLTVLEKMSHDPNPELSGKIDDAIRESIGKFISFKPTLDEVLALERLYPVSPVTALALRQEAFRLVRTAADFMKLVDDGQAKPNTEYTRLLRRFVADRQAMFLALSPTADEARWFAQRYLPNETDRVAFLAKVPGARATLGERCLAFFRSAISRRRTADYR